MEMLSVARIELAQRRLLPTRRTPYRLSRLHYEITDQNQRRFAHRHLHRVAHEPSHREHFVVPAIDRVQIADYVEQMKFLADFEHRSPPVHRLRTGLVLDDLVSRKLVRSFLGVELKSKGPGTLTRTTTFGRTTTVVSNSSPLKDQVALKV